MITIELHRIRFANKFFQHVIPKAGLLHVTNKLVDLIQIIAVHACVQHDGAASILGGAAFGEGFSVAHG